MFIKHKKKKLHSFVSYDRQNICMLYDLLLNKKV